MLTGFRAALVWALASLGLPQRPAAKPLGHEHFRGVALPPLPPARPRRALAPSTSVTVERRRR